MSNSQKWKDNLLSSGLPLEYSVRRSLENLGLSGAREFKYERVNEVGIPALFSIDIHTTKIYEQLNTNIDCPIFLELFIECKYRKDGTQWIFTPDEYDRFFPNPKDLFITLDELTDRYFINKSRLNIFGQSYELCGKGIELNHEGQNPKSIKQAIQQLRFAIPNQVADAFEHQVRQYLGPIEPLFVLIPMVVTTAELWRITPEVTIEDVRKAANLQEVAVQKDVLVLHELPDNELSKYTQQKLLSSFDNDEIVDINHKIWLNKQKYFEANEQPFGETLDDGQYEGYVNMFAANYPNLFLVVHYNKFEETIQRLFPLFETHEIIKIR